MKHILLITTRDQGGIIYAVSKILYEFGLNIEKNDEFVDKERGLFFMRTEIGEANKKFNREGVLAGLHDVLGKEASITLKQAQKKSLLILATKENHCLGDLLLRYESGELNAHIQAVIANHDTLANLVERFHIPFHCVSSLEFDQNLGRAAHEEQIAHIIDSYAPDVIALAKYMRILSPAFVARYFGKMISIHHSFLPAFIGANPYKQAYQRGVKIIGATAHFVTQDLDEGPIITQDITKIDHTYSWQDMQKAGRDIEKSVFAHALDLVLHDRVFINQNKTIIF